jgi:hypothetical protein
MFPFYSLFISFHLFIRCLFVENVPPEHFQGIFFRDFYKGERSCPFSLEKLSLFSPSSPCAESMAQGISLPAGSEAATVKSKRCTTNSSDRILTQN